MNVGSKPSAPLGKRVIHIVGCALCSARNVLGEELEETSATNCIIMRRVFAVVHPNLGLSAKARAVSGMVCDETDQKRMKSTSARVRFRSTVVLVLLHTKPEH